MRKLLPIILALIGLGAGVGAGLALKPAEDPHAANPCGEVAPEKVTEAKGPAVLSHDYIKLNNQFVVPVVKDGKVKALVVLSLSVEVLPGNSETIYEREPKLRDAFLRAMFDHANSGGFDGSFTSNGNLTHLRQALLDAGQGVIGDIVSDVLIIDIVRQDT